MACYVEGCIVKYAGTLWMIRGISHPLNTLLALPRYHGPLGRLKEPGELIAEARRITPSLVRYSSCYGRSVPLLRISEVTGYLNPLEYCRRNKDPLACSLVEELKRRTGVEDIGVTGSRLALGPSSARERDIDVIVYGRRLHDFYRALRENPVLEKYSHPEAEALASARGWPSPGPLLKRETLKLLQGTWRGLDVYIRLVPQEPDVYRPCTTTVYYLGDAVVEGRVVDDRGSYIFPCTYELQVNWPTRGRVSLTSPRGRFCESLRKGDLIRAWGRLEITRPGYTGAPRLQLSLTDEGHGLELLGEDEGWP